MDLAPTGRRLRAAVLITICFGAASASAQNFSIEEVLSAPFPSELTVARDSNKIAWVFNDQGNRNIWIAFEPDYVGRAITDWTGDDGQEILGLTFTPDASKIVYVRGGAANRASEIPNPWSRPGGAKQEVWVIAADGGVPTLLGEGASPIVSPDGSRVLFVKKGQVWAAPIEGGEEAEQLIHARGSLGSLVWSPAGDKLAFVSTRGDHAFVGVYDVASESVRYLDAAVDLDASPAWSPDGTKIAFRRTPASRELVIFGPKREAETPWSIRVADIATGAGQEIWRAEPGAGSAYHAIVAKNQIFWAAGDRIVFPWEREGWTRLYSVAAEGGPAKLITPGEHEVEYASLSADGASVVYSSGLGDINRHHLWRAPADGSGDPKALTDGKGIEWAPVEVSDGAAIAFIASDARTPAHPELLINEKQRKELAPDSIPKDFPSGELVEPREVIFPAADGLVIHGQLFLPRMEPGERRPAMLFFHGGSRRQMLLGFHHSSYYHNCYAFNQYLASRGFIVLAVNYRSGIGYGLNFREADNYGATGGSEFNDVLGAGLFLRSRPDVDPLRVGLWGGSYGGYLTALGLARASDLFAAGVDIHGVHDWNKVIRGFVPSYDPLADAERARLAFESSPMASLDTWKSPVLLIHGDDDRNVPFSETVELVEGLRERGVEHELLIFPDEVHGFLTHDRWLQVFKRADAFLERHLGSP